MSPFVIFGGVLALIVALVIVSKYQAKKRREAWQAVAPKLEMRYVGDAPLADRYPTFRSFSVGHSRRSDNLLEGESGSVRVLLGDYRYTTGSGKNSTTFIFTVCILEKAGLGLPHSFMRPQNLFDALGKIFGGQDIDFTEDSEFSRSFVLQGPDESAIRAKFDRPSRAWLVAHKERFQRFEANGDAIAFFAPRMEPARAPELLDQALEFLMIWG
ncbi:MAG: hypothetical protein QM765_36720 [Myxococcales bacterium]